MFFKNYTLWFQKVLVILLMSVVFVIPTSGATYTQWTQATIDDMTSSTDVDAPDATPSTRTRIGIGELVTCSIDSSTWDDKDCKNYRRIVNDTIGDRVWGCSPGGEVNPSGVTSSNSTTLTADLDPGSPTVAVLVYDSERKYDDSPVYTSINFDVIAPSGLVYTKIDDIPPWTLWSSGTEYLGAATKYSILVTPTNVSFSNVSIYENFGAGQTGTWPDGSNFPFPSGYVGPIPPNANNRIADTQLGGLFNSNKLWTGTQWQNYYPSFTFPFQYVREVGMQTFDVVTADHHYYHTSCTAYVAIDGVPGGIQGPWQAP